MKRHEVREEKFNFVVDWGVGQNSITTFSG
jgi:hypothetical protein